jgi:hypothetical protein
MAASSSLGAMRSAVTPSTARTCGEIGIDFSLRAQTPPPAEIFCRS